MSFQSLKPEIAGAIPGAGGAAGGHAPRRCRFCRSLWNVDETEARRSSRTFSGPFAGAARQPDESIRLHDLQLDYVRAQWPKADKEALKLIHGAIRLSSHVIVKIPASLPRRWWAAAPVSRSARDREFVSELPRAQRSPGSTAATCASSSGNCSGSHPPRPHSRCQWRWR